MLLKQAAHDIQAWWAEIRQWFKGAVQMVRKKAEDMAMTVKNLREQLAELPDDMLVVMSKDAEGNSFSPLEDMGTGVYTPDSTWSGDFETYADDEGTRFIPDEKCNAVCLRPVN